MHRLWHVAVLGSTLLGGAGLAIVLLTPLLFEEAPPSLVRMRSIAWALAAFALVLLVVEWLVIH